MFKGSTDYGAPFLHLTGNAKYESKSVVKTVKVKVK